MKKERITKTTKATKTARATKATRTKAPKATKTATAQATRTADAFRVAFRDSNGDTAKALKLTKAQRKAYAKQLFTADNLRTLSAIATRRGGATGRAFDISASFPIKSDLAKLDTIRAFENKPRATLTPRQVVALVVAYLMRDNENGFSRIFPTGLFIENGCLRDLTTAGFITADNGESTAQRFTFSDTAKRLFTDTEIVKLENTLATADLI